MPRMGNGECGDFMWFYVIFSDFYVILMWFYVIFSDFYVIFMWFLCDFYVFSSIVNSDLHVNSDWSFDKAMISNEWLLVVINDDQ